MTEQQAADLLYHRTKAILADYLEILREYLPSLNGVDIENKRQEMAFNLLERLFYNARGAYLLYDEYGYSHNLAVPLSQIFRALVYDVVMGYWLLKEGQFAERIILFNADYIRKNGNKISGAFGPERLQESTYKGWANVAPENFTEEAGVLTPVPARAPTFDAIAQGLKAEEPGGLFDELYLLYAVLSQQAHVSSFSKEIIYRRADATIKVFHRCCRGLLACSSMLVSIIRMGDHQAVQYRLDQLLLHAYPRSAAEQAGD